MWLHLAHCSTAPQRKLWHLRVHQCDVPIATCVTQPGCVWCMCELHHACVRVHTVCILFLLPCCTEHMLAQLTRNHPHLSGCKYITGNRAGLNRLKITTELGGRTTAAKTPWARLATSITPKRCYANQIQYVGVRLWDMRENLVMP